ncbi:Agamous-like MADS-box protein AGL80 [Linum grandiflorum]
MTMKKVKLVYITNDSSRKATFNKRKKGLMKKVSELSTLCGIQACAIVFSPYEEQPETWPPTMGGVHQEKFLADRIKKTTEQLNKYDSDNREKEIDQAVLHSLTRRMALHVLTMGDLDLISRSIDRKIEKIDQRMLELIGSGGVGMNVQVAPQVHGDQQEENVQGMKGQQCFTETMMNPTMMEDELMMMAMMHQRQGAGAGGSGGTDVGQSSSSVPAVSISNSNLVWASSSTGNPFFD